MCARRTTIPVNVSERAGSGESGWEWFCDGGGLRLPCNGCAGWKTLQCERPDQDLQEYLAIGERHPGFLRFCNFLDAILDVAFAYPPAFEVSPSDADTEAGCPRVLQRRVPMRAAAGRVR